MARETVVAKTETKETINMHVLVFGTSNSLLQKGWVAGLRQGGVIVDNWSVGMSPSTRFSAYANLDLSIYDFVFFDAVPNDEALDEEIGDTQFNESVLGFIFKIISNQSRLIVVGFCFKENCYNLSKVFMRHRKLAQQHGAIFIDVPKLLISFGDRYGLELNDLYEDHPAHPQSSISFEIGYSIALSIGKIDLDKWPVPSYNKLDNIFTNINSKHDSFSGFDIKERNNTAVSATFAVLNNGDEINFPTGRCIGIYINLGNTNAIVNFECDKVSYGIQIFLKKNTWNDFTKLFVPVPNILCNKIRVSATLNDVKSISRHSNTTLQDGNVCLELSDSCLLDESQAQPKEITIVNSLIDFDLENIFLSDKLSSRLSAVAKNLYFSKFRLEPHIHILEVCKMYESEGIQFVEQLMNCYDLGIKKYGDVKDQYNHYLFAKEKYRSLLNLGCWEKAELFLSSLDNSLIQNGWAYVLKARALSNVGNIEGGRREWQKVLNILPHHREAKKALDLD